MELKARNLVLQPTAIRAGLTDLAHSKPSVVMGLAGEQSILISTTASANEEILAQTQILAKRTCRARCHGYWETAQLKAITATNGKFGINFDPKRDELSGHI